MFLGQTPGGGRRPQIPIPLTLLWSRQDPSLPEIRGSASPAPPLHLPQRSEVGKKIHTLQTVFRTAGTTRPPLRKNPNRTGGLGLLWGASRRGGEGRQ